MFTWNIEAPYGVLQAFKRLSFPVETNHFPQAANRKESTHDSCRWSWYLSGFIEWSTSTLEFSIPTASHSPVGERKIFFSALFLVCDVYIIRRLRYCLNPDNRRELVNSSYLLDNNQGRKSEKWSHAGAVAFLLWDPTNELYYPVRQSIVLYHRLRKLNNGGLGLRA